MKKRITKPFWGIFFAVILVMQFPLLPMAHEDQSLPAEIAEEETTLDMLSQETDVLNQETEGYSNEIASDSSTSTSQADIVHFVDPKLKQAINFTFKNADLDAEITKEQMTKLSTLTIDPNKINIDSISSLEGLQYATNLRELILGSNNYSFYAVGDKTVSLTTDDISPLYGLNYLTGIVLKGKNELTDFSSFNEIEKLDKLFFSTQAGKDYVNLESLNVSTLYIGQYMEGKVEGDAEQLMDYPNFVAPESVKHLNMYNLNFPDAPDFSKVKGLETLFFSGNGFSDLNFLSEESPVNRAFIRYNQNLTDVSALGRYGETLTSIQVPLNKLKSLTFTQKMPALTTLYAQGNEITDVSFLNDTNCPVLNYVNIKNNHIGDFSSLQFTNWPSIDAHDQNITLAQGYVGIPFELPFKNAKGEPFSSYVEKQGTFETEIAENIASITWTTPGENKLLIRGNSGEAKLSVSLSVSQNVEETYTVQYVDGTDREEIFTDQVHENVIAGADTPLFDGLPEREGYVFAGWSPEVVSTVTGDATYVAQWERTIIPVEKMTVVFETNGGSKIDAINVEKGSVITRPVNPTKEGYSLIGWYKDAGFLTAWDFAEDKVNKDITLYAKWEKIADPTPDTPTGPDSTTPIRPGVTTPKTADSNNIAFYVLLIVTSGLAIVGIGMGDIFRKKKENA